MGVDVTDAENALADLEQRVREKLIVANQAAHPEWAELAASFAEWVPKSIELDLVPPLPDDWPQFPREKWITYPNRRTYGLLLADKAIDLGHLAEAGWLLQYAGKERIG